MASVQQRYQEKVVIITGGSNGIGKGCAKVFTQNGAMVVICDIDETEGHKVESECTEAGPGEVFFIKCDVTNEESIKNAVQVTTNKYGRLDCLINNAGNHPQPETIDETTSDDFRDLFNMNVISCFLMAKYCLPHLRKTKGNIINMASLVSQIGQAKAIPYVATKSGNQSTIRTTTPNPRYVGTDVHHTTTSVVARTDVLTDGNDECYTPSAFQGAVTSMTKAMAIDEAKYGVRVNSVSPGNVRTPLWDKYLAGRPDKEAVLQEAAGWQLNGRLGTPEEMGLTCLYLAADATFSTGTNIKFSGGAELNYGRKTVVDDKE